MKKTAFFVLSICLFSILALAGTPAPEPITIGETIRIESKNMDEERTILVSTPPNYDQNSQPFPVLYMTVCCPSARMWLCG